MSKEKINICQITPFVGVNEVKFGMSHDGVKELLGEASKIEIDNIMQMTYEYRDASVYQYRSGKLVSVVCNKHTTPMIHEMPIFDAETLEFLKEKYPNFTEEKRYIAFWELGICVGGFGKKKIPEGKLAIAFAQSEKEFYESFVEV